MKLAAIIVFVCLAFFSQAQTKTTQVLDDKYDGFSLFLYRNTLKMLNQTEDKNFDELIKDIEKMRFLMIDKQNTSFKTEDYKKLLAGYQSEEYEEIMTGRYDGRNFDIYLREESGDVKGTVILANDSSSLIVLDILGKIALNKAPDLFKAIDGSTDIGKKIKDFTEGNSKNKEEKSKSKN